MFNALVFVKCCLLNRSVASRVDMFAIGHMLQTLRLSCECSHVNIGENLAVDNLSHVTISMTDSMFSLVKSFSTLFFVCDCTELSQQVTAETPST